jgi:copper chaperone CopZ
MPMPTPPSPAPTPQPTPVAKKEAPAQPATFSGSVRMLTFSDAIVTGENANAKVSSSTEFDKIEAALKRVAGVTSTNYDASTRSINVGYAGPWSDLNKITIAVNNNGVSAELVSPAKIVYRPMSPVEDETKVITAVKGISGVQYVARENNDILVYADLMSVSLDQIKSGCEGAGVKGMFVSHEEVKVNFAAGGNGNASALQDDLSKTKWVLKVDIDSAGNAVKVLAVKGRVTKSLVKSLMTKYGFPEAK